MNFNPFRNISLMLAAAVAFAPFVDGAQKRGGGRNGTQPKTVQGVNKTAKGAKGKCKGTGKTTKGVTPKQAKESEKDVAKIAAQKRVKEMFEYMKTSEYKDARKSLYSAWVNMAEGKHENAWIKEVAPLTGKKGEMNLGSLEGYCAMPYVDVKGNPTVAVGYLITKDRKEALAKCYTHTKTGKTLTVAELDKLINLKWSYNRTKSSGTAYLTKNGISVNKEKLNNLVSGEWNDCYDAVALMCAHANVDWNKIPPYAKCCYIDLVYQYGIPKATGIGYDFQEVKNGKVPFVISSHLVSCPNARNAFLAGNYKKLQQHVHVKQHNAARQDIREVLCLLADMDKNNQMGALTKARDVMDGYGVHIQPRCIELALNQKEKEHREKIAANFDIKTDLPTSNGMQDVLATNVSITTGNPEELVLKVTEPAEAITSTIPKKNNITNIPRQEGMAAITFNMKDIIESNGEKVEVLTGTNEESLIILPEQNKTENQPQTILPTNKPKDPLNETDEAMRAAINRRKSAER